MLASRWLRLVNSTIGGSTAPAVLGVSPHESPVQAWRRIMQARAGSPIARRDSDDMRRGRLLEPIARQMLSERLGAEVRAHKQELFCRRDDWPWAHALPDGWCADGWIAELKVPRPGACARIAASGPPESYVVQCMHNAAVCRVGGCHLGVLDPVRMTLLCFHLAIDVGMVERIEREERAFWHCVETGQPPVTAEGGRRARSAEGREPPPVPHSIPTIDRAEVRELLRDYLALTESEEEIAMARKEIVARLDELVGPQEVYEVPGVDAFAHHRLWATVRVYRTETKPRRTFDWKSAIAVHPDLDDERFWKVGASSRPFRIYPIGG